jgi:uncharacterized protein YdhG (YjbR/CyaY superfamily)
MVNYTAVRTRRQLLPKPKKPERTIESYLAGLAPDAAFVLNQVRETLRTVAPDLRESIRYDMPLFEYAGAYLYAGAWKEHLGLYPVYPASDPALEAEIAPYRSGKDTVQFKYNKPTPFDLIARIARDRIAPR